SDFVSVPDGFTNHGLIELTSLPPRNFVGNLTSNHGSGTLVNAPDGVIRTVTGNRAVSHGITVRSINNQGLIEALEQDLTISDALFTTSGTVRISEGRLLTVSNLDIATSGFVGADGPASLKIFGSFTSPTQNPANLSNLAVTVTSGDPFEAMSQDR